MEKKARYEELLRKREWVREKLQRAKENLGHPHLDFMSAHDLAESDFKVFSSYLEEIELELEELKKELKI